MFSIVQESGHISLTVVQVLQLTDLSIAADCHLI